MMHFPESTDEHFNAMTKCYNSMIKMHAEELVPSMIFLPKWHDKSRTEQINIGDLVLIKKHEQSTSMPCFRNAIVTGTERSKSGYDRVITVKYSNPPIFDRNGKSDPTDPDWVNRRKGRSINEEKERINIHQTRRDSRSIIKLYPINQDFEDEIKRISKWFDSHEIRNADLNAPNLLISEM